MNRKKYLAEAIGTFALVFFGTGAVIVNKLSGGAIGHLGIAFSFGLIVTVMIYTFGPISGAHINPAVTLAFANTDRFNRGDTIQYIVAQIVGAVLASAMLRFLFFNSNTMGETLPAGTWQQSFVLEIILTFFLMLVIFFVSQNKETTSFTAIAVGGTVLLEALVAGPICGASMNPARSIGPALVSGNLTYLWVYIIAPIIGALLASIVWRLLKID